MLGIETEEDSRHLVYDEQTMETNVPGVFIAETAIAGTPSAKMSVIVETERLAGLLGANQTLHYIGRPISASPATGSHHRHEGQQQALVAAAVSG